MPDDKKKKGAGRKSKSRRASAAKPKRTSSKRGKTPIQQAKPGGNSKVPGIGGKG